MREFLVGRNRELAELFEQLKTSDIVGLIGSAGVGKSSICKAILNSKKINQYKIFKDIIYFSWSQIDYMKLTTDESKKNILYIIDDYPNNRIDNRIRQISIYNKVIIVSRHKIHSIPNIEVYGLSNEDSKKLIEFLAPQLESDMINEIIRISDGVPLHMVLYTKMTNYNPRFLKFRIDEYDTKTLQALILDNAQKYQDEQKYEEAISWYKIALERSDNNINIKKIYIRIGNLYLKLGNYYEAKFFFEFLLNDENFDLNENERAVCYNNLARTYELLGEYTSALELFEKSLAISESIFGKKHPSTATTYNNIALVYSSQGDYTKALVWYNKALEISEKLLGKEHPATAATYNNIAGVYDSMGDYAKALEWYRKALAISEKVLGSEHPDTAATYNNIALVYSRQGDYDKALEWYRKALGVSEKVLGKEHPLTATTYNNIAGVYHSQGDYEKALEWYRKALEVSEKALGKEHPDTATTYNNIAGVYSRQGEYDKALEWYRKALAISEKVLGKEHPDTATTYNNIASVYEKQGI